METIYYNYFIWMLYVVLFGYALYLMFLKPEIAFERIYNKRMIFFLKTLFSLLFLYLLISFFFTPSLKSQINQYEHILNLKEKNIEKIEIYKNQKLIKNILEEDEVIELLDIVKKLKSTTEHIYKHDVNWSLIIVEKNKGLYRYEIYKIKEKEKYLFTLYLNNLPIGDYESDNMGAFLKKHAIY